MSRNTLFVVFLALCAGATGGIVAQALLAGGDSARPIEEAAPSRPGDGEQLKEAVASLKRRVEELELQAADHAMRASRMEEEIGDMSELSRLGDPDAGSVTEWAKTLQGAVQPGRFVIGGKDGKLELTGTPVIRFGGFGKAGELMRMSEEDRWAKIREDLHLDSYQESELKQIVSDMKAEMKDMFKVDPDTGNVTASFDMEKHKEIRDRANERVKSLLSEEQAKKFHNDGYASALGLGGPSVAMSITTTSVGEPKDK